MRGDVAKIDQRRRVILVGTGFDFDAVIEAGELNRGSSDEFGERVACVEVSLAQDPLDGARYLTCRRLLTDDGSFPQAARSEVEAQAGDALSVPPTAMRSGGPTQSTGLIVHPEAGSQSDLRAHAVTLPEAVKVEPSIDRRLL